MSDGTPESMDEMTDRVIEETVAKLLIEADAKAEANQPAADWLTAKLLDDKDVGLAILGYWEEFSATFGDNAELFGDVVGGYAEFLVSPEDDDAED